MAGIPTVDEVREYVKVPASSLSDPDLERMRQAALEAQAARCVWEGLTLTPPVPETGYTDGLAQALLRRIQREIAARNLPLGMVGLEAEYGPANIPTYDALTEMHERPFRRVVLA